MKSQEAKFFYGYIVVSSVFWIMLAVHGAFYSFGVFFGPVLNEFGWTRAAISGAFALANLMSGLGAILMGRLSDKFGPRIILTLSGLLGGLGLLLMSQVRTIWQLYVFWGVVVASAVSAAFSPGTATISRWFVKRRAFMTGIVVAGVGAGTMIAPPAINQLIFSQGWRNAFIVVGIAVMASIVLAAQVIKRDPGEIKQLPYGAHRFDEEGLDLQSSGLSLRETIRSGQFWMIFAMYACHGFYLQAIVVHVVINATGLGVSPSAAAVILTIIGGVSMAGKVVLGNVADRVGSKLILGSCFALASLSLFYLTWLSTNEAWMFYLFAVALGIAYGGLVALEVPILAERFGLKSLGGIVGIAFNANTGGGAVGAVLVGWIYDVTGSYSLGFLLSALLCVTAFILTLLLPKAKEITQ